jgi:hypothetical protein
MANKRAGPIPARKITKAFRDELAQVARVQLFRHFTPEWDLAEGLRVICAERLGCVETLFEIPDLQVFITENKERIEPLVREAIQRAYGWPRMNGKPTSYGAMLNVVSYAEWPGLDSKIAINASANGCGSYTSNQMIVAGTGLSERYIRKALHRLEFEFKLIRCTENRKGGKGRAPRWDLLLSHNAFPNKSPNGKQWFSGEPDPNKGGTDSDNGGTQISLGRFCNSEMVFRPRERGIHSFARTI